ncbi:MAG TPA: FKBP-type peptidyl-prolyl cis-trans isomerase [Rhabdochlamydiaceae bacterium]
MFNMRFLFVSMAACSLLCADEVLPPAVEESGPDIAKVSEAFGHMLGKNIQSLGIDFATDHVVKGLQDALAGQTSPMSENECIQAITEAQEKSFKKLAVENLHKAAEFLSKNGKEKGVISLEDGKLQYKIDKKGKGSEVAEHNSALIRYTGKFIDGKVFGSSKEDELISLDETIPGFGKGLIGMKEGEKRTLYIHPELGYGTSGYLPPNSLLTFEIELVKANVTTPSEMEGLISNTGKNKAPSDEIAAPTEHVEAVR